MGHTEIDKDKNWKSNRHTLALNTWYKIEVNQESGLFRLYVNGTNVWRVSSGQAMFENVKWYQSDPWHKSAIYDPNGDTSHNIIELANLKVENGNPGATQ